MIYDEFSAILFEGLSLVHLCFGLFKNGILLRRYIKYLKQRNVHIFQKREVIKQVQKALLFFPISLSRPCS